MAETQKEIRTINSRNKRDIVSSNIFDIIVYISSIVTIGCAYFNRKGSLSFDYKNGMDWLSLCFFLLLVIFGIYRIRKVNIVLDVINIRKEEISLVNHYYWEQANESITIIGGDISWLISELDYLQYLQSKKLITIEVFCDRERVNGNTEILSKILKQNILIIPYKSPMFFNIRCLIIDKKGATSCKAIEFCKQINKKNNQLNDYSLIIHNNPSDKITMLLKNILYFIEEKNKTQVFIGISGVNNVGKTTAIKEIEKYFKNSNSIHVIKDAFRATNEGTRIEDNINALIQQITDIWNTDSKIVIMDRTPADTLAFLQLFSNDLYMTLCPNVVKIMRKFDLIINLRIKNDDFSKNTTLMTKLNRKIVYKTLNDFYTKNGINNHIIENPKRINASVVNNNIRNMCEMIENIYQEKGIFQEKIV